MKIKKVEYEHCMQGEAVISLSRDELCILCNGLFILSTQKECKYDKDLHIQMKVVRDILDYGAVDDFTFNTAVEDRR